VSLVELGRFNNRVEADLARLHLEAAGIEAVLFGAEMNSLGLGSMTPVVLMVLEDEVEEARQVLGPDVPS
jgi:hypothetical protein